VRVKLCVAGGDTPLAAVMVKVEVPGDAAVPLTVAVPLPLSLKVTPWGRPLWPVPVETLRAGVGRPLVVTVKVPLTPGVNAAVFGLVMAGAVPGADSTAPMEQFGPGVGRGTPRWSKAPVPQTATPFKGGVGEGIFPTAGLFAAGSSVWVGPPLSAREPRSGDASTTSVAWVNPQGVPVPSSVRL
jgi:hypothetical protein